jgi:hypothetical protein
MKYPLRSFLVFSIISLTHQGCNQPEISDPLSQESPSAHVEHALSTGWSSFKIRASAVVAHAKQTLHNVDAVLTTQVNEVMRPSADEVE